MFRQQNVAWPCLVPDVSLSMCAHPLRFVTTHSRLVLASAMRKTKCLRRRLYVAWPVPGSKKASEERNSERGKRAGREGRGEPVNINPPAHCPTDFLKKTFRVSKCKIVKTAKGAAFLTFLCPVTAFFKTRGGLINKRATVDFSAPLIHFS